MQVLRALVLALGMASLPAFALDKNETPPVPLPRPE